MVLPRFKVSLPQSPGPWFFHASTRGSSAPRRTVIIADVDDRNGAVISAGVVGGGDICFDDAALRVD